MISMRYKYQTEPFSNIPRLKQPTNQTKNQKQQQQKSIRVIIVIFLTSDLLELEIRDSYKTLL